MSDASFNPVVLPMVSFSPLDIARLLGKRKLLLLTLGLAGGAAGYSISFALPSKYQAEGTLVVRSQAMTADESERAFDSTVVNEAVVTTETQILTSAGLLKRVAATVTIPPELLGTSSLAPMARSAIERLASTATFIPHDWTDAALNAIGPVVQPTAAAIQEQRETFITQATSIVPTKGSSVIIVRATTGSPALSAAIVNEVLDLYMQERSGEQAAAAAKIASALRERLRQTETKISDGEEKLVRMLEEPGAIENSDIPGAMRDLSLLGPQIVQAEADVARRQAEYNAVTKSKSGSTASGLPTPEALALQRQLTDLQQQLAKMSAIVGSEFPARRAIQDQISTLKGALSTEAQHGIEQRRVALATAQATAGSLRQQLDVMRSNRIAQSSSTVGLARQRETVASLSRIGDALQTRLIDLEARVSNPNARVLSQAEAPLRATFPSKQLFAISGFILAMLSGLALTLTRAHQRQSRPMAIQLARQANAPLLGSVPRFIASRQRALPDLSGRKTVKGISLPETLQALALELEDTIKRGGFKSLMVTSAYAGEGKTTVTTLLGHFLAAAGMRVLLVDLDLRYPSIARMLAGRGRVLEDAGRQIGPYPVAMAPVGEQATMHVLTPFPMGTADADLLFRSSVFQDTLAMARMSYDLVLIDTGPIMAVPDAIKIAELCDAIVLTAELGRSTDAVMQEVLRRLNLTRKPICGVIVTKIDGSDRQAGTYSGYTDHRAPPGRAMIEHSAA